MYKQQEREVCYTILCLLFLGKGGDEPWPLPLLSLGDVRIDPDPGGIRRGEGVEDVGKKEQEEESNGKEWSAAQSSVSFSLEKETYEPLHIPFLISPT